MIPFRVLTQITPITSNISTFAFHLNTNNNSNSFNKYLSQFNWLALSYTTGWHIKFQPVHPCFSRTAEHLKHRMIFMSNLFQFEFCFIYNKITSVQKKTCWELTYIEFFGGSSNFSTEKVVGPNFTKIFPWIGTKPSLIKLYVLAFYFLYLFICFLY